MKTSCETDAKKLARLRIWSRFAMPQDGRIAILSGPENGDARCLRAKGLDPSRLVCVDAVAKSLESAQAVEPRASYHHGDFRDALRAYPCAGFFLDECRIASPDAADYLAECASLVPAGAPIAAAYMYGRWPFAGKAPSWKKNHEHWADYFTKECRRAFEARGLAFDCDTVIGYKGKGVPMLAFVGRVGAAGTYRKPRVFWVESSPAKAKAQVRAWAVKAGADLLNVSPATLGAWRAVTTRTAARRGPPRVKPRDAKHAASLEGDRARYAAKRDAICAAKRSKREAARGTAEEAARREKRQAYHLANREKLLEKKRAKYAACRELRLAESRAYREAHREALREKEKGRIRVRHAEHPDRVAERGRAYREALPERTRERYRVYREANLEARRAKDRDRYVRDRQTILDRAKTRRENNLEVYRARDRARREAKKAAQVSA